MGGRNKQLSCSFQNQHPINLNYFYKAKQIFVVFMWTILIISNKNTTVKVIILDRWTVFIVRILVQEHFLSEGFENKITPNKFENSL